MLKTLPVWILVSLIFVACGESGGYRVRGERCKKSFTNPVDMKVADGAKGKFQLKTEDIPVGTYTYGGAEIYFVDSQTKYQIHIQDKKQKNGGFKAETSCVRNASPSINGIAFNIQGLASMKVEAGNSKASNLTSKSYVVQIEDDRRTINISENKTGIDVPSKPYEDEQAEHFLFQKTDTEYQIRSHKVLERGEVYLLIYLNRGS